MRYYVAYKFLEYSDKEVLKERLENISSIIEKSGNETFIFYRDEQKWGTVSMLPNVVISRAFEQLSNSDVLFVFVDSDEKSEGMLLECGFAKALNKKIVLVIKKGINLRFLKSICDVFIEFDDVSELNERIKEFL